MITTSLSPANVRARLKALGLSPRKALGQHFLLDPDPLQYILEAAELNKRDVVLEVGPGIGALTTALAEHVRHVVALELDKTLASALTKLFAEQPNVQVLQSDARKVNISTILPESVPYKLIANLPYYAANPILRHFLEASRQPTRLVVMVQREVAQGMAAPPGRMGLLAVAVQFYGTPTIVGYVQPESFWPPPKVTSAIVRIDVHAKPFLSVADTPKFFSVVRAGFSAPRKQLRNALSHSLQISDVEVTALLNLAEIDPRRRAETLSLPEWAQIHTIIQARQDKMGTQSRIVTAQGTTSRTKIP